MNMTYMFTCQNKEELFLFISVQCEIQLIRCGKRNVTDITECQHSPLFMLLSTTYAYS